MGTDHSFKVQGNFETLKHGFFYFEFPRTCARILGSKYMPPTATPGDQFNVAAVSESSAF